MIRCEVHHSLVLYSRTPLTRTLKGNENLFELAGFRVIGVDLNIQFFRLIIKILLIFSTSVYNAMQIADIKLISSKKKLNNCNDKLQRL